MRKRFPCNHNWIFHDPQIPGKMETVTLPHTIGLTPANASGGRNILAETEYECLLTLPVEEKGRRILLRTEGIMGTARFFLNGSLIGSSLCSYIPKVLDLTDIFCFEKENHLQILADNRPDPDVPPGKPQKNLDFMYDGGIYRTASLITTPKLFFTEPLLQDQEGGGGIFVHTISADTERSVLGIQAEIQNNTGMVQQFILHFTLLDPEGKPVWEGKREQILPDGAVKTLRTQAIVSEPKLWSPETPALYQLVCEILSGDEIADQLTIQTGIRDFRFTFEKGLIWNGEPRVISGANYHPVFPYIGAAVPQNLLVRDLVKLRKLGMKNLRSHYPFDEALLDACDRLGMTVIVSNPGWQWFREGVFADRLEDNIRKIIRWQRNHPCIILWEPMPNESFVPMEVQQRLHDAVHAEYPFSPCYTASDKGPTDVSYRLFDPGMLEPGMDGYDPCKRYGTKSDYPVWIREYGDCPDNWTDQSCSWRSPRGWGDYAMVRAVERMLGLDPQCPDSNYIDMYGRPNLCGYGIWPGIEYNRGYHVNPCWGGLLDLFRIPKFTADFMNSQQDISEAGPIVSIANWWTDVSPQDVTVYSNAETIRLYHNDVLVEERSPEPLAVLHPPFVFENVWKKFRTRDRSTLRAEAVVQGRVVAEAVQMTPGVPCQLVLEADTEGIPLAARGEDIIAIHCRVTDQEGNTVARYADHHPILFSVSEGAEIVGDASIGANPICPEAGIATVLIRSAGSPQKITVTAGMLWPQSNTRAAIRPGSLTIESV